MMMGNVSPEELNALADQALANARAKAKASGRAPRGPAAKASWAMAAARANQRLANVPGTVCERDRP